MTKKCVRCGAAKESDQFYKNKALRGGLHSYCKKCVTAVNANWRKRNPLKARGYTVKHRYSISGAEVRELIKQQEGRCAICMRQISFLKTGHVDHDHGTGEIRGVLCGSCNRAIGLFKDDIFVIREAAAYLENFQERMDAA